eukprot:1606209-Rhodomonas_salina.1
MSQYPMLIAIHRHTQYEYGSVLGALSTAYRSVLVKLDYTEVAVTVLSDSGVLPLAVRRLRLSVGLDAAWDSAACGEIPVAQLAREGPVYYTSKGVHTKGTAFL